MAIKLYSQGIKRPFMRLISGKHMEKTANVLCGLRKSRSQDGGPATCPDLNLTKLQTNVTTKRSTISINMQYLQQSLHTYDQLVSNS